jgi:hypothetical protein
MRGVSKVAKTYKKFLISSTTSSQDYVAISSILFHKNGSSYEVENAVEEKLYDGHTYNQLLTMGYAEGVQASDAAAILERCKTATDAKSLQAILNGNFIYPGRVFSYCKEKTGKKSETYQVSPIIEALFFEHKKEFKALIEFLLEKNDQAFYQAFMDSVDVSDLRYEKLFCWDKEKSEAVTAQLEQLEAHGRALAGSKSHAAKERGDAVTTFVTSFRKRITTQPIDKPADRVAPVDYKAQLETLKFKLGLYETLDEQSKKFSSHRDGGVKTVLVNLCSLIFTAGLANLCNLALNGSLFFQPKTQTQEDIEAVKEAIEASAARVEHYLQETGFYY